MNDIFNDIRPYTEEEAGEKISQIIDNESYQNAMRQIIPEYTPEQLKQDAKNFNTIYDFQTSTSRKFIEKFYSSSSTKDTI